MLCNILLVVAVIGVWPSLSLQTGYRDLSTYYEGDSPIIILSQHGGYQKPSDIPDRHDGCYDSTNDECIWEQNCEATSQDDDECGIKTFRDSYTKELALCLQENAILTINGVNLTPHLIISELHRSKLDSNREIGEATLGNSEATEVYNDIHSDFMVQAKTAATEQCGFGLVIDVHGQSSNKWNQLGYALSKSDLKKSDADLDTECEVDSTDSCSIETLAKDVVDRTGGAVTLSDIVRGEFSLGSIMNKDKDNDYLMVPSTDHPFLDTDYYYSGGYGVKTHGSDNGEAVDAIQIEANKTNRFDATDRNDFCLHFSAALVEFVEHWYDVSQCELPASETNPNPVSDPDSNPVQVITINATTMSLLIGFVALLICLNVVCIVISIRGSGRKRGKGGVKYAKVDYDESESSA